MPSPVDRLASSESGAVAPITALSLIALVSVAGLAYDVSRGFALKSELDNAVDAAALAGATQLDGQPNALDRARAAAKGSLARNPQLLADAPETAVAITNNEISFLDASRNPVAPGQQAQFIQIDLTSRRLGLVFGALARIPQFDVAAHAVAGYGAAICKAPPILICNPDEANGSLTFNGDARIGQSLVLSEGGSGTWGPGNFAFLDVTSLNNRLSGVAAVQDAIARADPQIECIGSGVKTVTATVPNADQYLNVRFDLYGSQTAGLKGENSYQPALNTITALPDTSTGVCTPSQGQGFIPYTGSPTPTPTAMALPMDRSFYPNQCMTGAGNGDWDRATYFDVNHGPNSYSNLKGVVTWSNYGPNGVVPNAATGIAEPTRYQVYQWELAMLASNNDVWWNGLGGQPSLGVAKDWARPICFSGASNQPNPDRRTFSAIVANCSSDNLRPGSSPNIIGYVDVFLTEPASYCGGALTLRGEILGASTNSSPAGRADRLYTVRLYE